MTFLDLVALEIARARKLHEQNIHSPAEGYAVILEEVEEFWDQVRLKPNQRSNLAMLEELVQIAAMCMRAAEDCGLVEQ